MLNCNDPEGVTENSPLNKSRGVNVAVQHTAYGKRWLVLFLFVMYSASNAFQWIQLVIISNVLEKYYNVSTLMVTWTALMHMVTYIPLIFPASWFLQKKGLRVAVLLGSLGTCLGSWMTVLGTGQESWCWPVVFGGQTVVAISQIFILGIPADLAATWFPSSQVSTACAVGVLGNQLGIALGSVIPPIVVRDQKDASNYSQIGYDLLHMFLGNAILTSVILILVIASFDDQPPSPPSRAQELGGDNADGNYLASIKRLATNGGFMLLLVSYGLNVGVFYAIQSLLNIEILKHFDDAQEDAGGMGLVMHICGIAGMLICGFILDKTHQYKRTTLAIYFLAFVGMLLYTSTIS